MPSSKYFKALSERGRKMARARWAKRDAELAANPPEPGPEHTKPGDMLGTLTWIANDGTARKWVVRQGQRKDQIRVRGWARDHGWAHFCACLRRHLNNQDRVRVETQ